MKQGFDTNRYLKKQTEVIMERVKRFGERLYLEFGGKLSYDFHAARVLPGYEASAKIKILQMLKKNMEIVYCISAKDIQKGKIRRDFGLDYSNQTIKDIIDLKEFGIAVSAVVITRFDSEESATRFKKRLENLGIKVYVQNEIKGYPNDIEKVVSDKGYGSQPYVKIKKRICIVTGPGGNSGKMGFCLAQLYHEHKKGVKSGFAKFETFPIWNLVLNHPVNVAYESATADLGDVNMIDPFHLKAYRKKAVNYNRDIENFDIMKKIMSKIVGEKDPFGYKSPTDMGVNMAAFGITNDDVVKEAAKQEIIRRYFRYKREAAEGAEDQKTVQRAKELMEKIRVREEDRRVVGPARKAALDAEKKGKGDRGIFCGAAIQLEDGSIITGKNSALLHAESAAVINAIKKLADIPDNIHLISPSVIQDIKKFKQGILKGKSESLNLEECSIALAISAAANPMAKLSIEMLDKLKNCEIHTTHMPTLGDEDIIRKLNMNLTTDGTPAFSIGSLKKKKF